MDRKGLAHDYFEATYRSSVAYQYAKYALSLDFDSLPEKVVHEAKRILLDTLGCAIAAYDAPGRPMVETLIEELGGTPEATVFGSGLRTNAPNAALVNCFLVRYLDYNDIGGGGHNSEAVPSILAVSEREGASGAEFLTALVASYEIGYRFRNGIIEGGGGGRRGVMERYGWTIDIRAGVNVPPAVGMLMGLSEEQIANAIGCCASRYLPLKILDANDEEFTMTKNLRFGGGASEAIEACILAKHGFTGPIRIVEGDFGMNEVLFDGEMDINAALDFGGWKILDTQYKTLPVNGTTHGHVLATLSLVEEHDLRPEDISSIIIRLADREYRHTASLHKRYPRNGETADHSAYFANALAVKERSLGPDSYREENFSDPVIWDLIEKITVERAPDESEWSYAGTSRIITNQGEEYTERVEEPLPRLSDESLEEKFYDNCTKHMDDDQIADLMEVVWDLDRYDDLDPLIDLLSFE